MTITDKQHLILFENNSFHSNTKQASSEQKEKIIHEPFEHQISSNILKSRLSSDVKFGNYCDAIKQSVEFESIISILSDVIAPSIPISIIDYMIVYHYLHY